MLCCFDINNFIHFYYLFYIYPFYIFCLFYNFYFLDWCVRWPFKGQVNFHARNVRNCAHSRYSHAAFLVLIDEIGRGLPRLKVSPSPLPSLNTWSTRIALGSFSPRTTTKSSRIPCSPIPEVPATSQDGSGNFAGWRCINNSQSRSRYRNAFVRPSRGITSWNSRRSNHGRSNSDKHNKELNKKSIWVII